MERKIIVTGDNSKTLLIPELNETYHSTKGALTESKHVFIKEGLVYSALKKCKIFEMGFGTGLNALLTLDYAIKKKVEVNYHCIEAFPLDFKQVSEMAYPQAADLLHLSEHYKMMHEAPHEKEIKLNEYFTFKKIIGSIEQSNLPKVWYDIVFYDAFGPKIQPELWTAGTLSLLTEAMKCEGVFVTYCAQGAFRRALKTLDMDVSKIPGPPGKREMTRAIKTA